MTETAKINTVGLSGILITFAEKMSEPANRAALAFRAQVEAQDWPEVLETSTSLISTFLRIDLVEHAPEPIIERLREMLTGKDWLQADLPKGRTLWHIPTVYGSDLAPQLEEAAAVAGVDPDTAVAELSSARVRVLTIGFAPGQPYLGALPDHWNIPRQSELSAAVPAGALIVAVAQLVLFTNTSPTGWRHIGQTAFRNFRPEHDTPFSLTPGDELIFPQVDRATLERIKEQGGDKNGGAEREELA
ncbi:MAG: 5-oxoprolinase subunit B family protein [Sulfitobacter sp.]